MRSDSEVLSQIASDVAEIKAAVNSDQKRRTEPERCADLTPESACMVIERWRKDRGFRANLPPRLLRDVWMEWEERDCGLIDFRGDLYRGTFVDGTRDQWRSMTQLGGFKSPGLWYFRPHGATWEHVERLAQNGIRYGWISAMQEVGVIDEPPRLNYRSSDVVLSADVVVRIRPESEAFTIATTRLKPLVAFKPERLAVSLSQSARWQNPTKILRAECLDLSHLTIMRIRSGDNDIITEPMSARSQSLGGGFAWPAVRADSEMEITLAISNSVLDSVQPPFGSTKGDFLWVSVRIGLLLTGSKLL